ncbi:hypothetical protein HNP84_003499 [Thermocatellispora tengchongensis]|uniref:Heparinase II/III-like C-terminal domain-containing protein n=1 Tax=Thermocatellispora tengchongensis TaxID=1073253 RepID=A0A840P786_9ACTN|nr:heparinase II/III family protein [Thermocatellispora tengchongensis]MBB5133773.1 hypothetical protein [Thermocatellispora tengchongensis]
MISLVTGQDVQRVRDEVARGGKAAEIRQALRRRAERLVRRPGVVARDEPAGWWHVVSQRLCDVAFAHRLSEAEEEPEEAEAYGRWLRTEVLAICDRPADDWIGPDFRPRTSPSLGTLETAHIGLAVAEAVSLCPDLFTAGEHDRIRRVLRDNCQAPCRRALDLRVADPCNWFMVLLDGYGTVSAFLGDAEAVARTVERHAVAAGAFEEDSYGESLQYWSYAGAHLAHLREVLLRHDPSLHERLDLSCYTRCVPWAVHSLLYVKPLAGWGEGRYPRSLNFGDSSALFRPSADLLLHIAARARHSHPREAGLARWLFDVTYHDVALEPLDGGGFGFFNQVQWRSLTLLPDAAGPVTPEEAKEPTTRGFACGTVAIRDTWPQALTVLGVQGGTGRLRTAIHRHADEASFILSHRGERFFADPGHCCYRLTTQAVSSTSAMHNTWTFRLPDATTLWQHTRPRGPGHPPLNRRVLLEQDGGLTVVRCDAAAAYGPPIRRAERTWIAVLPHVVVVADRIEADEPVAVDTHFVLNDRDGALRTRSTAEGAMAFRRGGSAVTLTRCAGDARYELLRSWGYMHDVYDPRPNRRGQGREGSAEIHTFAGAGHETRHTALYAIVMDTEPGITAWQVTARPDGCHVTGPGGTALAVSLTETGIAVEGVTDATINLW